MKKFSYKVPAKQAGFTLVELIVVIVILGIMAATALPKFADVGTDARIAKMKAAAGAVKTAAATAHALYLVQANSAATTVTMDGTSIAMTAGTGYPTDAGILTAAGISSSDYKTDVAGTISLSTHTACAITYDDATGAAVDSAVITTNCD